MRLDYSIVANWVQPNSQVLDLGCGDGSLLLQLQTELGVKGYGLEIDQENILRCVQNGVNVIEQDIENGLSNFEDDRFDTVIMSQAIQTLQSPKKALAEMLRIGKECVITFPNFGHWKARLHLAFNGRMPVSDLLPYEWYDTPNIHFCTFKDFDVMCQEMNATIINRQVIATNSVGKALQNLHPNLFGETALYRLRK